jgi:hypothetical protein
MDEQNTWYGHATIDPTGCIVAGSYGAWRLTYVAGKYGIDNSGALLVCWRFAVDWGRPQTDDPAADNYLTAATGADAKLKAAYTFKGYIRPWYHAVTVDIHDGEIRPGQRVVLTFGDRSSGSVGQRSPTAVNKNCEWLVLADPFHTRRFTALHDCPSVKIVSGEAARLVAVLPSDAVCGEPMRVVIRAEDAWGNPAAGYRGTVRLAWSSAEGALNGLPPTCEFTAVEGGVKTLEKVVSRRPCLLRLRVIDEEHGLECISNPCLCHPEPTSLRRHWGDLHGQSIEALGIGTAYDYFGYARDVAGVDFASNQGNDFDITDEGWRQIQDAVRKYNEPHRFVAFLGSEWSGTTSGGGDHNVVYLRDDEPIRRSSHANVEGGDTSTDCYPISELYRAFAGREDVMIIPHVGGRYANFDFHDPSLERLVEIYSGWGLFEWFLSDALRRGMRVGFVGTSDDHKGRPGAANPGTHIFGVYGGLTCVLAKELTREAVFGALRARRCYATTGQRILLDASCNEHPMGEEFRTSEPPTIRCRVVGTAGIEFAEILRATRGQERPSVVYAHPINAEAPPSKRIRIAWSGFRQIARYFQLVWDGRLTLNEGSIVSASGFAFDSSLEGIVERSDRHVTWRSQTAGDEDGIIVELDAPPHAHLRFETAPATFEIAVGEIGTKPTRFQAKGFDAAVALRRLPDAPFPTEVELAWTDARPPAGVSAYFVRVVQEDGGRAYSSPFYVGFSPAG